MRFRSLLLPCAALAAFAAFMALRNRPAPAPISRPAAPASAPAPLAGSTTCRQCHPRFHQLWSTSHHGLAMQPFSPALAASLAPASAPIPVGRTTCLPDLSPATAAIRQTTAAGSKSYPILHAMGGKNVYYFLTPLDRGRLQVLPLAYDIRRKEWFDTAASGMRHFTGVTETPLDWTDPLYTFNTSCHGCHVSQLTANYDSATDTYRTTWVEPGINCETCHGPSAAHILAARQAPPGQAPTDLKIILTKSFTPEQHNSACSTCHAKGSPITAAYAPGQRFFDHFDLVALENPDYYPDGRDLGENYTATSWRMSTCAKSGKLSCIHCHTSSGRSRFEPSRANDACLPCHAERVKNPAPHTHHKPDGPGNSCISCHMPTTEFARMRRADHSMRPPTPAATVAFKSPNACNLCHADKDAVWADQLVRQWHPKDYQAPVLHKGALIAAARRRDWSRLPEMLAYLADPTRDEVFATSFLRLLLACPDDRKWTSLRHSLADPSPLVRSAAASLASRAPSEYFPALVAAARDEYRLVRIRAAESLAGVSMDALAATDRAALAAATAELEASLKARPDDWGSRYNLGNYYTDRGQPQLALESYQFASKLRPDAVQPLVNAALIHARLGQNALAEASLARALQADPANAVANLNMGMLKAELNDLPAAERHFRAALKAEPTLAQAAYNLAVILAADRVAADRLPEAIDLLRKARQSHPAEPKYAYTLAFYLNQANHNQLAESAAILADLLRLHPTYLPAYTLLASQYEASRDLATAKALYQRAMALPNLEPSDRLFIQRRLALIRTMENAAPNP